MRYVKFLMSALMVFWSGFSFAADEGSMRISLIQGDVQIYDQDIMDWTSASINLPLSEGDRIRVPEESRAEIQILGGLSVRADELTALDVLDRKSDDLLKFYLDRGRIYVHNEHAGLQVVQVGLPAASVRIYDDSTVLIALDYRGDARVSVLNGYADAESREGPTGIPAGTTLTLRDDSSAETAVTGYPDEWEQWNRDRDAEFVARGESSRYLPDELKEYSSDFDVHGEWSYTGEYGYVWSPTITVVEWAPYTMGQWIWIRNNYVWISHEPWGWAPYHYGRWAHLPGRGWCWVPPMRGAVRWGPGFVGWVVTPAYVAWVPLAPGEIYYAYGSYGPASINLTTINVNKFVVRNTFMNSHIKHGVTVVERNSFGTGKRVRYNIKENPFLHLQNREIEKRELLHPRFKPEKRGPGTQPSRKWEGRALPERTPGMSGERRVNPPVVSSPSRPKPGKKTVSPSISRQPHPLQSPDRVKNIRPQESNVRENPAQEHNAQANRPAKIIREPKQMMRNSEQQPRPVQQQAPQKQKDRGETKEWRGKLR